MGRGDQNRNRHAGRGGRGGNRSRNNNNNNNYKQRKGVVPVDKLLFATGHTQAENYTRLIEAIGEEVQLEYGKELAHIIKKEEEFGFNRPTFKAIDTSVTDKKEVARLTRQYEMDYKADDKDYRELIRRNSVCC